jgi:hypothetical protein
LMDGLGGNDNGEEIMGTAGKCRQMGLQIGDTIEGSEGDDKGTWWNVTRLTLLWMGEHVAVWSETHTDHTKTEWTAPKEETNWSLDYRDWRKVTPNG